MRDSSTPTVGLSLDCVFNTPEGLVPLDWLDAGDMVETYDAGFQPIERVDRHKTASNVIDLGGGVLAGQRMLAAGWAVEMYFGYDEMLVAAGDVSAVSTFSDEPWAQVIMCEPMLLRAGGVWVESHGGTRPVHPVLSAEDVTLIKRAFGCPLVQTEEETHAAPMDVLTTFGSRAAVA